MRDPLTKADLIALQERNPTPDARAMLWEIRRLRGLVLRSHDLVRLLEDRGGPAGVMIAGLKEALKDEPCVEEQARLEP